MQSSVFLHKLLKLKVDRSKGAPAPHKAILLLSIFQLMEEGEILENEIPITPQLVAKFKDNWHELVIDNRFTPNFALPFYHLGSSKFWFLKTYPGKEVVLTSSASISSLSALRQTVVHACFDDAVFHLLRDPYFRHQAMQVLLSNYFNGRQLVTNGYSMLEAVEDSILHEAPVVYQQAIKTADEEEIFVRGGVFKKVVPKIYNYTCCISGLKITSTRDMQMIDACHIVPFAESFDDTIKNGLSLSPNLHRAFDRFLITINRQYEVIVSDQFTESGNHSIKAFHGKKIQLPTDTSYHPSMENIKWHFEKFMRLH